MKRKEGETRNTSVGSFRNNKQGSDEIPEETSLYGSRFCSTIFLVSATIAIVAVTGIDLETKGMEEGESVALPTSLPLSPILNRMLT